ncbi:MAG: GrpB family protein [Clostridia bacterium]|nr:GrpB family protein [Clostridia bacterium]
MAALREIRLSRHMSSWDSEASVIISRLTSQLGENAVDIQHIGSTAVRGILAVPVIDIAIALTDGADIDKVVETLAEIGFFRIPTDETGCVRMARAHRDRSGDAHHLYITRHSEKIWKDLLAFRTYLNNHVFAANEYEELKKDLAKRYRYDQKRYAAEKSRFIQNILRLSITDPLLGKHLTIVIDRPLGSVHPKHPDLTYTLNYGFVPGIPAADGENLDAYIYGVNKPLRRFTGTVIAVIHRKNDNEDKLVVAPSGMVAYEPMIEEAVRFAEQYFDTSIICIYEKSCGGIIYRVRPNGGIEYLILYQHRSGTWSVPKGHIAAGETERETALREIREETGLTVALIEGFRRELSYTVSAKASKNVVIFLAEATGELSLGENEISDAIWADKSTAIRRLGGRSIGRIIESAEVFIKARLEKQKRTTQ